MWFTSRLGQPNATLNAVQPGYRFLGTATYHGPFPRAEIEIGGVQVNVKPGDTLTVAGPVASQLAQSDLWWFEFH